MLFIIQCHDKPEMLSTRLAHRPAHLEYLTALNDRLIVAGPLLDETEQSPIGSLIIADFDNRQAANDFARQDPYAVAGLFASVNIMPYRQTLPAAKG